MMKIDQNNKTLSLEQAFDSLIQSEALEVYIEEDQVSIPYMMNDAVECYFVFENCKTIGEWEFDLTDEVSYSLHESDEDTKRHGLFISQGNKNTVSIWYTSYRCELTLYQYHEIGHFWVKGHELMRRLVYIIGTIHDKCMYLGKEFCNETELSLMYLMEFAPFRYFSPISESLDAYYVNSEKGLAAAKSIAAKINEKKFDQIIKKYEKHGKKINERQITKLGEALAKCPKLYAYLVEQIDLASLPYEKRQYSVDETKQMELMRQAMMDEYTRLGFTGAYPVLHKDHKTIHFYEEHPYVARDFEYKDYEFSIKAIEEQ